MNLRADVVGSLLRPPALLQAREKFANKAMAAKAFKGIEDRAVSEAVALQDEAGLKIVTDGEMRRLSFQSQMTESVDGFGEYDLNAFLWGDWHGDERVGEQKSERPTSLGVIEKLKRWRHLSVEEFTYLRALAAPKELTPKITLPSPSLWVNFWPAYRKAEAYPTLESYLADVVDILREEVAELVRLGATYIQIDAPHYTALLDVDTRAFYESQGWTIERWLEQGVSMDNALMDGPPGVTFGFHL